MKDTIKDESRYYTDVVETDGNLIKFVDQDGKPRLIEGDVTITENGTPRDKRYV